MTPQGFEAAIQAAATAGNRRVIIELLLQFIEYYNTPTRGGEPNPCFRRAVQIARRALAMENAVQPFR